MLPGWANKISNIRLSSWIIVLFGGAVILPWFVFGGVILAGRDQRLDDARHNLGILAIAYGEGASVRDKPEPAELRRATALSGIRLATQQMESRPGPQRPSLTFAHANGAISAKAVFPAAGIAAIASQDDDRILEHWRQTVSLEALGLALRSAIALAVGLFLFLQLRWRENTLSDLAKARIAAEGSNMAKANFLANMS
ncbi:MAG: hypothetical protein ACXWLJ_10085, partial [Rhizomicrobium sp.]